MRKLTTEIIKERLKECNEEFKLLEEYKGRNNMVHKFLILKLIILKL